MDKQQQQQKNPGNLYVKLLRVLFSVLTDIIFTCMFSPSTPDLGRDPLVTGKQAVEIKHTLKEPRSLADPVRTTGHTRELHLRDVCWRQANGKSGEISPHTHI